MRNLKISFSGLLRKVTVYSALFLLAVYVMIDHAKAQQGSMIQPLTSYSSIGISLFLQTEVTRIDSISERIAERMAERALRRAERKAEMKAARIAAERALKRAAMRAERKSEIKASKKAAERAATHNLNRKQKLKERSPTLANRKLNHAKRIGINRIRKYHDLYDDKGFDAIEGELLILTKKDADLNIEDEKYQIKERKYLKGLDLVLTRVISPKGTKLSESALKMGEMVGEGEVGLNHLFITESRNVDDEEKPYLMADISENLNLNISGSGKIILGLIDTLVDRSHAALQNEVITIEDFVPYDKERPKAHGTAVASILVGNDPDIYKGVVSGARLYAASVFFMQDTGKVAATTESLIYALDWLVQQKVQVINMSLSGPSNDLLEIAVSQVLSKGVIIVAAVGNAGPTAPSLYPAAYSGVVAVTAVDNKQHVYWRANRGQHVVFSAPGVNIPTAHAGGGYQARSGTSIAAPFVSAILADMVGDNGSLKHNDIVELLEKKAIDLGVAGFDTTYGYGLIQAVSE